MLQSIKVKLSLYGRIFSAILDCVAAKKVSDLILLIPFVLLYKSSTFKHDDFVYRKEITW